MSCEDTAYSKGVNQTNKYLTNYPKEVADETFDAVTEITTMRKYWWHWRSSRWVIPDLLSQNWREGSLLDQQSQSLLRTLLASQQQNRTLPIWLTSQTETDPSKKLDWLMKKYINIGQHNNVYKGSILRPYFFLNNGNNIWNQHFWERDYWKVKYFFSIPCFNKKPFAPLLLGECSFLISGKKKFLSNLQNEELRPSF